MVKHFYQVLGEDWFTYPKLYSRIVSESASPARFVEVGSWKGRSSAFMAVEIINSGKNIKLDCVDTWMGSNEVSHTSTMSAIKIDKDHLYNEFLNNMRPVLDVVTARRITSIEGCKMYADMSLDFVFIDAAHDYNNVRDDIRSWFTKVKIGGIIAGHDYDIHPGVKRAVDEFFAGLHVEYSENCWIFNKADSVQHMVVANKI